MALREGWLIVSDGLSGAQLQKPKVMRRLDKICLVIGVITIPIYGLGLFLVLLALLDYAYFTKQETMFLPRT